MKSTCSHTVHPEAVAEWLQKEMGYRPLGPYASSKAVQLPSADSLRKVFRGNMIPVWSFLLNRVKSEKTVDSIRRNILVHGGEETNSIGAAGLIGQPGTRGRKNGNDRTLPGVPVDGSNSEDKEAALQERELAEKEVERLTNIVKSKRKELSERMLEVSGEEAERERMLDDLSDHRHKQVMLRAYVKQCDDVSRIFTEYHKRLHRHIKSPEPFSSKVDEEQVRAACETLASTMIEKCRRYDGIRSEPSDEAVPEQVTAVIVDGLRNPPQFLRAVAAHASRLEALITEEIEGVDAESPRYVHGAYGATSDRILERQKAHVRQFISTEDAVNRAGESRLQCEALIARLDGNGGGDLFSSNMGSLRQLELDVLSKEREAQGLRASLDVLMMEEQRLHHLRIEGEEAEDSLKAMLTKIRGFDARRSSLESLCNHLLGANRDAAAFWTRQPVITREQAARTVVPACEAVARLSLSATDRIALEMSTFHSGPHKSLPEGDAYSRCRLLESLRFCLRPCASESGALLQLARAVEWVRVMRGVVGSGRAALEHAGRAGQEYRASMERCVSTAREQERTVLDRWLPELATSLSGAQKGLQDCKYISGLLEEWWEQPASSIADWVLVDGQNVTSWSNHVKQLLAILV